MYNRILDSGEVPSVWKDVTIAVLFKNNGGEKWDCDNYRGLSLASHLGKVLEKLIRLRIWTAVDSFCIPTNQFGFRRGKSTIDAILTNRVLSADAKTKNIPLYKCYIDLTKAYDKVNRELLWTILRKYGMPEKFVRIIINMHEGARGRVRWKNSYSDWFNLKRGLKQGSVLSPLLWNIFWGVVSAAIEREYANRLDSKLGLTIRYKVEKEMYSDEEVTKILETGYGTFQLTELFFADDGILYAESANDLQEMLNIFVEIAESFGLEVSVKKTKVLRVDGEGMKKDDSKSRVGDEIAAADIKSKGAERVMERGLRSGSRKQKDPTVDPHAKEETKIYVKGQVLDIVSEFKYLGSKDTNTVSLQSEVRIRKYMMIAAFKKYAGRVFQNARLSLRSRIGVFKAVIMPNGLYGCVTWNLVRRDYEKLETTFITLLRQIIMDSKLQMHTASALLEYLRTEHGIIVYSIQVYIQLYQIRYVWKVQKASEESIVKRVLCGEIVSAHKTKKRRGRQRASYRQEIIQAMSNFGLDSSFLAQSSMRQMVSYLEERGLQNGMEVWELQYGDTLGVSKRGRNERVRIREANKQAAADFLLSVQQICMPSTAIDILLPSSVHSFDLPVTGRQNRRDLERLDCTTIPAAVSENRKFAAMDAFSPETTGNSSSRVVGDVLVVHSNDMSDTCAARQSLLMEDYANEDRKRKYNARQVERRDRYMERKRCKLGDISTCS